jgi:hypothetical protein
MFASITGPGNADAKHNTWTKVPTGIDRDHADGFDQEEVNISCRRVW